MKRKIQKLFSIEEWKNGAKIETRCGNPVRILCADIKGSKNKLIAAVDYGDHEDVYYYNDNGFIYPETDPDDIVIVEEIEEPERWAEDKEAQGFGYFIVQSLACVAKTPNLKLNKKENFNVFATEKQAKSALAMARISQLMKHDVRYGGVITDEEWKDETIEKQYINREGDKIDCGITFSKYYFLAFHTAKQRNLFLAENERLVKDYLMID